MSATRAVLLVIYATALAFLVGSFGSAPTLALASPVPLPLVAAYRAQMSGLAPRLSSISGLDETHTVAYDTKPAASIAHRQDYNDILSLLTMYNAEMGQHAQTINNMASQPPTGEGVDSAYSQQFLSALTSFHGSMFDFERILDPLSADKGLEYYDKNNAMETLLKDYVNTTKDTLKNVDVMVYAIPSLGPILGPIVYEIKCIVDDSLDAVENMTDDLINAMKPLLVDLGLAATQTTCDAGIQIAGLCVPL
ncbi:hypothetical protein B0H21DRAFT_742392 [Amylocystis lapponica]|nr:hypothetical protein B0H21DRAFT_742392 [Amylocystis lapponica]